MKRKCSWVLISVVALATLLSGSIALAQTDEQVTVVGIVEQNKRGVYLTTDTEKYMVIGQDLSGLVGRKVKVVGKVIENNRGKSLMVAGVEIVRN